MKKLFISYSRSNTEFVDRLADALTDAGHEVTIDRDTPVGEVWKTKIRQGIKEADAVIVCLSPLAVASEHVKTELILAEDPSKPLFPLMVVDCYEELRAAEHLKWILNIQILNFIELKFDNAVQILLNSIENRDRTAVQRVFAQSDSPEFKAHAQAILMRASRVVMVGTGLNILDTDPLTMTLFDRAMKGECSVEIYMADPESPAVQTRLIEEEAGIPKPRVGRSGLKLRIRSLVETWKKCGSPTSFSIKLFAHYPSFALLILDSTYFVYPYGYIQLGNFSPVLELSDDVAADRPFIRFLETHYENVKRDALDASLAESSRRGHNQDPELLHALAVYYVPQISSPLYEFGSEVLGYDVRNNRLSRSSFQDHVGSARQFGIHVTIVDVLYFLAESQIEQVEREVEFLAQEFRSFTLSDLVVASTTPNASSIALAFDDTTGSLEALHHELVHRVNRTAVASNYTIDTPGVPAVPASPRAKLMTERYLAPFILGHFHPHMTLLTKVAASDQDRVSRQLASLFAQRVPDPAIRVDGLAIMTKPPGNNPWRIRTEIELR